MCRPPTGGLQRRAYVKWFFLFRKAFLINQSIPHPSSDTDQSPEESGPTTSTHLASSAANAAALVGPPRLPVILSPPSGGTERSEALVGCNISEVAGFDFTRNFGIILIIPKRGVRGVSPRYPHFSVARPAIEDKSWKF